MSGTEGNAARRWLEWVSLGWRFAVVATLTVTLVVGASTFLRQYRDLERDGQERARVLDEFMGSLVADVEAAPDLPTVQARLDRFYRQAFRHSRSSVRLDLVDGEGQVVASTDPEAVLSFGHPAASSQPYAYLPVYSRVLGASGGTLAVSIDAPSFAVEVRRQWRTWFLEMLLLVVTMAGSLVVANHFLITRPLNRLQAGVRQMGQGYLGVLKNVRGAPEWRFLGREIWRLGTDLEQTVRRLVEAQRQALNVPAIEAPARPPPSTVQTATDAALLEAAGTGEADEPPDVQRARSYLQDELRLLETQDPGDPEVVAHAQVAWDRDVMLAERLGDLPLRTRLDDAALRVLDPEAYDRVHRYLASVTDSPPAWLGLREAEIRRALDEAGIPLVEVQRRAKHLAGIWRKMQALDIEADQVQDLFGFRVIVPQVPDCYRSLDVLHRRFEPQLLSFKDYIARPKPNGYRSLHTHLRASDGRVFEVQIRTSEMHLQADGPDGNAAHWRYKTGGRGKGAAGADRGMLARLREL